MVAEDGAETSDGLLPVNMQTRVLVVMPSRGGLLVALDARLFLIQISFNSLSGQGMSGAPLMLGKVAQPLARGGRKFERKRRQLGRFPVALLVVAGLLMAWSHDNKSAR